MVTLKQINAESIVYSLGIGEDLSFSEKIIADTNCSIFAFDPTPKSIKYVKESEIYKNPRFKFYTCGGLILMGDCNFICRKMRNMYQDQLKIGGELKKSL